MSGRFGRSVAGAGPLSNEFAQHKTNAAEHGPNLAWWGDFGRVRQSSPDAPQFSAERTTFGNWGKLEPVRVDRGGRPGASRCPARRLCGSFRGGGGSDRRPPTTGGPPLTTPRARALNADFGPMFWATPAFGPLPDPRSASGGRPKRADPQIVPNVSTSPRPLNRPKSWAVPPQSPSAAMSGAAAMLWPPGGPTAGGEPGVGTCPGG